MPRCGEGPKGQDAALRRRAKGRAPAWLKDYTRLTSVLHQSVMIGEWRILGPLLGVDKSKGFPLAARVFRWVKYKKQVDRSQP